MKDLKTNYKSIRTVGFITNNGTAIKIALNGDSTLSVTYGCANRGGIQADYNKNELQEYIKYLQTFHKQMT